MALIKPGNGSSLSGLVGGIVVVQTKKGSYMRGAPQYNEKSWTPNQLAHRQRFKKISIFCKQFKETVLPQIWKNADESMSAHALFLKTNMPAFSSEGRMAFPLKLKLSTGRLEFPQGLQLIREATEGSLINVSWANDGSGGMRMRDELMVVSAGEGVYSDIMNTGLLRGNKGGTFELHELSAEATHLYLFFGSKDRRDYSVSECFELINNN